MRSSGATIPQPGILRSTGLRWRMMALSGYGKPQEEQLGGKFSTTAKLTDRMVELSLHYRCRL